MPASTRSDRKQDADADRVERTHRVENPPSSGDLLQDGSRNAKSRRQSRAICLLATAGATGGLGSAVPSRQAAAPPAGSPATIALAISCSPMTTCVAPCFFRCSISASEWARAMIGSAGVDARAPAPPPGRPRRHRGSRPAGSAPPRGWRRAITSGSAALPVIASGPSPLQPVDPVGILLDHQQRRAGLEQRLADEAADAAVADQHDMVGQRGRAESPPARRLGVGFGGAGFRRPASAAGLRQHAVERGEEQRIEQDRDDRAGEDQVAPALRQQRERHAEAGEDERELADLREARRDRERGRMSDGRTAARSRRRPSTCRAR